MELQGLVSNLPKAPDRDLLDLAQRFGLTAEANMTAVLGSTSRSNQLGSLRSFWITDLSQGKARQIDALLHHTSEHAYWYVEDGAQVLPQEIRSAAVVFEEQIYPAVNWDFGGELIRAADDRMRITILHARLGGAAGYFSAADEYPRWINPISNEREMIYVNLGAHPVGSRPYFGVLAHEFQHAVHWNIDSTEEQWVTEGLSELAQSRLGFPSNLMSDFMAVPNVSLVHWNRTPGNTGPSYGAAHLFMAYLSEHYGNGEIRGLVEVPEDGIHAIDVYLEDGGYTERFPDVFADWAIANYLDLGTGPYSYRDKDVRVNLTSQFSGIGTMHGEVSQYGISYIGLNFMKDIAVSFQGVGGVPLIPISPPSGSACWWGNRGDSIDATLTREVDLRDLEEATMSFQIWHDLEENWDYVYLSVSTNEGQTWQILDGSGTTRDNPLGTSFGPGYTGTSKGWRQEAIDLSSYAGLQILLRFEHVTDDAITGDGVCIDDIFLPEIDFFDDTETKGDWIADGFFRTKNSVAQRYIVQVVELGQMPVVRRVNLDTSNYGEALIRRAGESSGEAIVVVAALAEGTAQPAPYTLTIK